MRTQIVSLLLCLLLGGAAQAQLMIDFGPTAGGTAAVETGYQGYFATDKNAATFTAQSYVVFGATVSVKVGFATGAVAAGMRAIDRSTDDGLTDHVNLLRDWIGWDNRNTPGNPLSVTLSGLPAGAYQWVSYHHDAQDQTGIFSVTVTDASGSVTTTGIDISNTTGSTVKTLADATKFSTKITSNGKADVVLAFTQTSPNNPVAGAIFVINGFELTAMASENAIGPNPAVGATDVPRDGTTLSWIASLNATAHDVYLGTSFDEVDDATTSSPACQGRQDTTSFDPGRLTLGATYYWRVDETSASGTTKGDVWYFTVEPVSIALAASQVKATASSSASTKQGPEKTIDGSGLTADKHSINTDDMWLSAPSPAGEIWIQYDFDRVYELHQMLVWNHNGSVEPSVGFGLKDVTIACSMDGTNWTTLGTTHEIAQAPGEAEYAANTTIDFGDVAAQHVKITVNSNWGGFIPQYGLSEVRFMVVPTLARQPVPTNGATGVDPRVPLSWRSGREAAGHKVYLSEDPNAVRDGIALVGTVSQPSFDASKVLALGKTYYWKVVEVNDSAAQPAWAGDVWSFTVQQYLGVDDFESYTNESPKRVFQAWIDGWGFSEDEYFPTGNPGNGSGAIVGYDPAAGDIMETAMVHGGVKAVPVAYDNSTVATSEAVRTFDSVQDWTAFGVKGLLVWFCGKADNTAATLYVKVNNSKVTYDGEAGNLLVKSWNLWYIPLSSFTGTDLKKVTKMTIGLEGGQGTVLFDDIALSPFDRQQVTPVKPAATNLVAYYAFEGNANSSTNTLPGTLNGTAAYAAGKVGQSLKLNGATDYVTMQGSLTLPEYSAAVWFRVEGGTAQRDILSVYEDGGLHGLLLEIEADGVMRYLHRSPIGGTTDINLRNRGRFDDGAWYHVAVVKSASAATLYINGAQVASATPAAAFDKALTRIALGVLKHDSLSRYFPGQIDELYLYSRALSAGEVASLAGRTKAVDQ